MLGVSTRMGKNSRARIEYAEKKNKIGNEKKEKECKKYTDKVTKEADPQKALERAKLTINEIDIVEHTHKVLEEARKINKEYNYFNTYKI